MCIYTPPVVNYDLNDSIKFCKHYELINSNSSERINAIDQDGNCIFHSSNIKWKRSNDFDKWLFLFLDIHENIKAKVDLRGCHFISADENQPIGYLDRLLPHDLEGAVFWSEIYTRNIIFDFGVNLEHCTFKSDVVFDHCEFKLGTVFSNIYFHCEITGEFKLDNCKFLGSVDFCDTKIKGSLLLHSCDFSNSFLFLNNELTRDGLLEVFSTFNGFTLFSNLNIASTMISFTNSHFNGETIFSNIKMQPEQQIIFSGISVKESLLFSGEGNNRIFHGYTEFHIDLDRVEGKITFQGVNLSSLNEEDRQGLIKSQSSGKVIIERGCIKYRLQSEEIVLDISSSNQLLIDEITAAYRNFFLLNTGKNLGVEIVERTNKRVILFYFSDENMTQEEFLTLLENNRKYFFSFFSNFHQLFNKKENNNYFVNAINGVISLMTISLRASLLISVGMWKEKDTQALLNSIKFSNKSELSSEDLHNTLSKMDLPDTIKNLIENNDLNLITINQVNQNGDKSVYIENNRIDSK